MKATAGGRYLARERAMPPRSVTLPAKIPVYVGDCFVRFCTANEAETIAASGAAQIVRARSTREIVRVMV